MMDYNNHGRLLERLFHKRLLDIFDSRDIIGVYEEDELKSMYGWNASSVDYLIELKDSVIVVQVKYRRTRRRENHAIRNYLNSIEYLKNCIGKPVSYGLWVSRVEPFADNKLCLSGHKVVSVSYFENMDVLIDNAINELQNHLRNYNVI